MKKIISLILSLMMISAAALTLVACSDDSTDSGANDHVCKTPDLTIGANGNWFLGDTDTGIQATITVTNTETEFVTAGGVDYCMITITFSDGSQKVVYAEMPKNDTGSGDTGGGDDVGSTEEIFNVQASIANAYGGANGIVCLMTDNDSGKFETLALLDELYIEYGLVGGLGTVVKNLYTDTALTSPNTAAISKWQEFLDTGRWKIINHSMTHTTYCDFVDGERVVNEERLYSELVTSAEKLRELFPDQKVLTYAMTGTQSALGNNASSDPTNIRECERELIAQYYIGGRFKGTGATAYEDLQWNNLPYALLSRSNLAGILNNIDKAATEGKYYMVYNHYVIEDEMFDTVNESSWTNYTTAKALCERVSQYVKSGQLWNAHFEDAVMYMRERDTASLIADFNSGKITLLLTDEMDNTIYDHALTIKTTVPESWAAVKITQNGKSSYAEVKNDGEGNYVYANVTPDLGEATIEPVALSELPEVEEPEVKPTPDIGKPQVPATAPVPDVYTFDTLDGYLGGVITFDNAGIISSKVTIVSDGDEKYLKMEKPEGETNPVLSFKGNRLEGGIYHVTEFKMKVDRTSSGGEIYLGIVDERLNYAYRAYMSISGDSISFTDYRSGDGSKATASNIGKVGDWITLKLIYAVSGGKAEIVLYADGTEVLRSENHYIASSAPVAADDINMLRLNFSQKYLGDIYFEDLTLKCTNDNPYPGAEHEHSYTDGKCSCGATDPTYTPSHTHEFVNGKCSCGEEDPTYTPTTPSATYTFDTLDGYLGSSIVFNKDTKDTNTLSIVTEGDEKLLKLEKLEAEKNPSILFSGEKVSGATSFVVEMDMRIEMTGTSGDVYFSLANSGGYTYAYRAYIQIKSNGTVNFADYSKGDGATTNTASNVDISNGTPFKIKFIYTTLTDGTVNIKAYINNEELLSTDNYHDKGASIMAVETVEKIRINPSASFTGSIYVDNLTVKQIAE